MNKGILALVIIITLLFAVGCNNGAGGNDGFINEDGEKVTGIEEKNENGEFVFYGKVTANESRGYIEVEIVDSQIAFGIYHVLVDEGTVYLDSDGKAITREDIKVDDRIEIVFSGQVMMSIPAKIYGQKIILK